MLVQVREDFGVGMRHHDFHAAASLAVAAVAAAGGRTTDVSFVPGVDYPGRRDVRVVLHEVGCGCGRTFHHVIFLQSKHIQLLDSQYGPPCNQS
jgi:hypothetical protein